MTNTTFDQLVALARSNQDQAAAAAAETERQEQQRAIEKLRGSFPLTEAERAALGVSFHTYINDPRKAYAAIPQVWADHLLVIGPSHGRQDCWDVEIRASKQHVRRLFGDCPSPKLRDQLVLAIADYRDEQERLAAAERERWAAQQEHMARWEAERQAQEAEQQRREAAIATRREELLTEHATIQAEVDQRVAAANAAANAAAWRWPEGQTITLYRWHWQTAGAIDSDGELQAEHDQGISLQSHPDADGFVTLQPRVGCSRTRTLRPTSCIVVEKLVIGSLAELPSNLRRPATLAIPGIGHAEWNEPFTTAEGDRVAVEAPDGGPVLVRGESRTLHVALTEGDRAIVEPLEWVKALL